jgi:hypothetical protein
MAKNFRKMIDNKMADRFGLQKFAFRPKDAILGESGRETTMEGQKQGTSTGGGLLEVDAQIFKNIMARDQEVATTLPKLLKKAKAQGTLANYKGSTRHKVRKIQKLLFFSLLVQRRF